MKRFLTQIAIFILLSVLFLTLFHFFLAYPRKKALTLPEGVTTVFLGNSTVELAINDSLIPRSHNFARSSETFELLYAKLKLLKCYNPRIDTVIVSFDDAILTADSYVPHGSPKAALADVYSLEDWWEDINYYSVKTNKQFVSILYHFYNIKPIVEYNIGLNNSPDYIGGFHPEHRSNLLNEILQYEAGEDVIGIDNTEIPTICQYYLDKIVNFCKKENIVLIFLSVPKYKYFWNYQAYRKLHEKYYPDIPLIDCMTMALPDSCYVDVAHLNNIGADIFSEKLKEILKRD